MSNSHKKTQKQKRPVIKGIKVNNDDYVQIDVAGDGNCFYYSIYGAAKYHADPTTYDKLLTCMGIRKESVTDEKTFAIQMRLSLAREILKEDGIMEQQEKVPIQYNGVLERGQPLKTNLFLYMKENAKTIYNPKDTLQYRDAVHSRNNAKRKYDEAEIAFNKAQDELDEAKTAFREKNNNANSDALKAIIQEKKQIYKNAKDKLAKKKRKVEINEDHVRSAEHPGDVYWEGTLATLPRQIQDNVFLSNANNYRIMTITQFKNAFVKLLAGTAADGRTLTGKSKMYASTPDIFMLKFFLERCANSFEIIVINPHQPNSVRARIRDKVGNSPILTVYLLDRHGPEHYNYFIRGDKYAENESVLKGDARTIKKQHIAKGNTPETPETPESNTNSSLPPNSNSSNSTKRAKKTSATTKAATTAATAATTTKAATTAATTTKAATTAATAVATTKAATAVATTKAAATTAAAPATPQNMQAARLKLAQMRAEKAAKEDAQKAAKEDAQKAAAAVAARKATPVPSGKNVTKHPAIKQWNPFNSNTEPSNNNANNASNIPLSVIEEGKRLEELRKARAANAAAAAAAPRPIPSAPPASPPAKQVLSAEALPLLSPPRTNSTRKAKKPSSPAKGKSMSPTTRKLYNELMAKEQPLTGFSAAAVANNLPSNSNNSLPSNSSNNEDSALQAALKASKEEHDKNAKNKGRKALIEGILDQYKQPAPALIPAAPAPKKTHKNRVNSILALYNQPQQPSTTQKNLIKSLGPKRKGGSITKRQRNRKH